MYANMYIVLSGPPGVRKNTAINIAKRIATEATTIRFAPDDTGAQRQGLITAIKGEEDEALSEKEMGDIDTISDLTLENIANLHLKVGADLRDKHFMWAVATELAALIGTNANELLTFLTKMWDGESYSYQLRKEKIVLNDALLSILAGTTPTSIAQSMPVTAMGQGLMSRIILVYGNQKWKNLHRPIPVDPALRQPVLDIVSETFRTFDGEMEINSGADRFLESVYTKDHGINDTRFVYYRDRRSDHLIKTGMCIAASEGRRTITEFDLALADSILAETEVMMPDALGEYGLSPIAGATQRLFEFIEAAKAPIQQEHLWLAMARDMRNPDFLQALMNLTASKKILRVQTTYGLAYTHIERQKQGASAQEIMGMLGGAFEGLQEVAE